MQMATSNLSPSRKERMAAWTNRGPGAGRATANMNLCRWLILCLSPDEGRVVQLIRAEGPEVEDLHARFDEFLFRRVEDALRRPSRVFRSRPPHEVAGAAPPHPPG